MTHMSNIYIRSMRPDDLQPCLEIDPSFSTDYVWQMESHAEEGQISVSFRSTRLPRSMQVAYPRDAKALTAAWQACATMLIADISRKVVGYASITKRVPQSAVWLDDLVVARSSRRSGVGTALLEGAQRWGVNQKLKWIIMEVQTKNYPAISFCQKHGMTFCGFSDRHFPNQDIALFFAAALH